MRLSYNYSWYDYLMWPAWVVIYYLCQLIFALCTATVNIFSFVTAAMGNIVKAVPKLYFI